MKDIGIADLLDLEALQQIQDGFADYTGLAVVTTDQNGIPFTKGSGFTKLCNEMVRKTEKGLCRCEQCDRDGAYRTLHEGCVTVYRCHAGLLDFATPIIVNDEVIGSFVGGQIRPKDVDEDYLRNIALDLGINPDEFVQEARNVHQMDIDDVERAAKFFGELGAALSKMAYNKYLELEKSKKLERIAKSQSEFMLSIGTNMESDLDSLLEDAADSLTKHGVDENDNELINTLSKIRYTQRNLSDSVDYMKATDGELELAEAEYQFQDLVLRIEQGLESTLQEYDIDFQIQHSISDNTILLGDCGRISQIACKLVQNFFMNINQGKMTLFINIEKTGYATKLVFDFVDYNSNISDERAERVVRYFNNIELNDTSFKEENVFRFGLVKMMLEKMTGKIEFYPEQDGDVMHRHCKMIIPQLEIGGE